MKSLLSIFLLLTTAFGCSPNPATIPSEMNEQFLTAVSATNMNENLRIEIEGDQESFRRDSKIALLIYNESPYSISFIGEEYLKLYMLRNGEWAEVENELTYSGSQVLSPKGTILLDQSNTWAKPALNNDELSSDQKGLPLRIVIIGEIMEDNGLTGEFVGAYVDVYTSP